MPVKIYHEEHNAWI